MRYDFDLVQQLCLELGFSAIRNDDAVEIQLGHGAVLCFINYEKEEDCLIGFRESEWHFHGTIEFCGSRGYHIEMDYLDILIGLKDGKVLICEQWKKGVLTERSLVHSEFNDEFKYLEADEEIRVRRAVGSQMK